MRRPSASPMARLLCGALALGAGAFAIRVTATGELATRGGVARLDPAAALAVGGLLGVLALGAAWVAVTGRGGE